MIAATLPSIWKRKWFGTPSRNIGVTLPCLPRLPAEAKAWPQQFAEVCAHIYIGAVVCVCVIVGPTVEVVDGFYWSPYESLVGCLGCI